MEFDLKDNQTAAKMFYNDDSTTIDELERFAKAVSNRMQRRSIIGTDMWELFVLQSARQRIRIAINKKERVQQ